MTLVPLEPRVAAVIAHILAHGPRWELDRHLTEAELFEAHGVDPDDIPKEGP